MPDDQNHQYPIRRLVTIWLLALAGEGAVWWLFMRSSYYRDFFLPLTIAILIAAVAASWRAVRGRTGDERRDHERRHGDRREE